MVVKVFKSVIRDVIMEHLLSSNLILCGQHGGFMPMSSCMTQLLSVMDDWTDALGK